MKSSFKLSEISAGDIFKCQVIQKFESLNLLFSYMYLHLFVTDTHCQFLTYTMRIISDISSLSYIQVIIRSYIYKNGEDRDVKTCILYGNNKSSK